MDIKLLALTFFGAILANNYVLQKFKGICPFLGVSKKLDQATGMGIAVTAVMLLATAVTWPIYNKLLIPLKMDYMQNIVFIVVIASLVQALELLLKKFSPSLHKGLGVYLPLITTNCAVLGITIDVSVQENFLVAMVATLGCGLGFLLAMVLFSGLRTRIHDDNVPAPFRGLPVTLIAASFISLAFMGFGGIVENIFK